MVTDQERREALDEVRLRLKAVERLQLDQFTLRAVPPNQAAWGSLVMLRRAEQFIALLRLDPCEQFV